MSEISTRISARGDTVHAGRPVSRTGRHRSPVPSVTFGLALVLGAALDVALWRAHVWVDKGVAYSFMATWLAGLLLAEAIWDNFLAPRHWVEREPRQPSVPGPLARTKQYWPCAAFVVGLVVGHVWWW
jgi:hypothetical protein